MSLLETASWRPLQLLLYPARVNVKLGQRRVQNVDFTAPSPFSYAATATRKFNSGPRRPLSGFFGFSCTRSSGRAPPLYFAGACVCLAMPFTLVPQNCVTANIP